MASPLSVQNLFNVDGLVAVITGGGSGLGANAARALDANGAKAVYIVGRREEPLKKVAASSANGKIIPVVGDITSNDSLAAVADRVRNEQGYVNVLYANAGVLGPKLAELLPAKPDGGKPTIQEFQAAMFKPEQKEFSVAADVNVTATFYTAIAFLDLLDAGNKQGNVPQLSQVLVTSSIAGFSRVPAAGFAYSFSKAGTQHLIKMLSTRLAEFHIRVNGIAPGMYPSEMTANSLSGAKEFEAGKPFAGAMTMPKESTPMMRSGSEEDIAGTVLFMVSQAGAYLSGNILVTDGGRLGQLPAVY